MTGESTWMIMFLMALERQIQVDIRVGPSETGHKHRRSTSEFSLGCHGI